MVRFRSALALFAVLSAQGASAEGGPAPQGGEAPAPRAEGGPASRPESGPASRPDTVPASRPESGPVLRAGDKLKITFYETMEIPNPAPADKGPAAGTAAAVIQTFYQRIDLSGEYAVEQGGTLSLPFFGFVAAAGKPLETLRTDLMGVFETAFGRPGGVTVGLVQRAPVFVVGSVRSPGAYPYTGGMIVLQAVALAGGRDKDPATLAGMVESFREREREDTARARLKRALARRAALAGRTGQGAPGVHERLKALAGPDEVAALLAAETKVARLEANLQAGEEGGRKAAAEASVGEVDLLRKRLETYGVQIAARGDRLRTMEALFSRQVVESERVADVRRDFVDMEGRRREYEVGVLQAELRQRLTREALEQGAAQQRLALEREVALAEAEIASAERALSTASVVGATMSAGWSRDPRLAYRIVRAAAGGPQVLAASEIDTLEPGDVLKVVIEANAGERGREAGTEGPARSADPGRSADATQR